MDTDSGHALSIALAREKSQPIYFIRSPIGTTLEVTPSRTAAINAHTSYTLQKVKCKILEQRGDGLYPLS